MRHTTCDICGCPVDKYDPDAVLVTEPSKETGIFGALTKSIGDICGDCVRFGRAIDYKQLMVNVIKVRKGVPDDLADAMGGPGYSDH